METRTYVTLMVSSQAFEEIKEKLEEADYHHAFDDHDGKLFIDMHGLYLTEED